MCCKIKDVFLKKIDFNGSLTSYTNKVMKGLNYRLLRDKDVVMEPLIDYVEKPIGGFDLLSLEMSDDTTIAIQFY